ncbi:MAG: GNAT family N-acetyltransferase [Pirellulales bacterium]|nr:GNAT family N-acetyltransferase [Pirellulales bacterium]
MSLGRDPASLKLPASPSAMLDQFDQSEIVIRDDASDTACSEFLTRRDGSIYLYPQWDRVFAVYGLETLRLTAWRRDSPVGLLPLVWQMSTLLGTRLISLPWFDSAGVVANDEPAANRLVMAAREAAMRRRVPTVELRQARPVDGWPLGDTDKALLRLRLTADPDELWHKLPSKVRNQVRKGEKSGLSVEVSHDAQSSQRLVPEFHRVYATNMRDMGSPSHSLRFLETVVDSFPDKCRLAIVRLNGNAVGGGLTLASGRALEIPWASSSRQFGSLCVNHVMYWQLLRTACVGRFEWFHFGRSTIDSGPYHFKKQWGAEAVPLAWHVWCQQATGGSPRHDRRLQLAARLWRRLPLSVARRLGPRVIRHLP